MTDAVWKGSPSYGDFNVASNWAGDVVPDGSAVFGYSDRTSLYFSKSTSIGTFTFALGSPGYSFVIPYNTCVLTFTGIGIVNESSFRPSFVNDFVIFFDNGTSAGNADLTN